MVIEKAAHVRDSLNKSKFFYDKTLFDITKFQNDYMSKYDIITHGNTLKIKNKSLNNIKDRIDFFVPNKEYVVCFEISSYEILCSWKCVKIYNFWSVLVVIRCNSNPFLFNTFFFDVFKIHFVLRIKY